MYKLLVIALFVGLLPSAASAGEQDPMEQKTLLERLSTLQVFKLRLPQSLQRSIKQDQQDAADLASESPDSCHVRSKPHQKGAVDYSCDAINSSIKKELSSVAAN